VRWAASLPQVSYILRFEIEFELILIFRSAGHSPAGAGGVIRNRHSFGGKGSSDDSPGKAFGIGGYSVGLTDSVHPTVFFYILTNNI